MKCEKEIEKKKRIKTAANVLYCVIAIQIDCNYNRHKSTPSVYYFLFTTEKRHFAIIFNS